MPLANATFFLLNTKHQSGVHFFQQLLHDSPLPIDTYTQCYINMLASIFNLCQRTSVRPYCFILLHETINMYFYVLFGVFSHYQIGLHALLEVHIFLTWDMWSILKQIQGHLYIYISFLTISDVQITNFM